MSYTGQSYLNEAMYLKHYDCFSGLGGEGSIIEGQGGETTYTETIGNSTVTTELGLGGGHGGFGGGSDKDSFNSGEISNTYYMSQ